MEQGQTTQTRRCQLGARRDNNNKEVPIRQRWRDDADECVDLVRVGPTLERECEFIALNNFCLGTIRQANADDSTPTRQGK